MKVLVVLLLAMGAAAAASAQDAPEIGLVADSAATLDVAFPPDSAAVEEAGETDDLEEAAPFEAPSADRGSVALGGGFSWAIPQGEFDEQVHMGFGLGAFTGYHFARAPVFLGLDFNILLYGSESRKEPFSTTIPDVTVDVRSSNNILLGHALVRVQTSQGGFRPYGEGLIGLNYLFTRTSIDNESSGEEIASSTNQDDAIMSWGWGGGIMFRIYQRQQYAAHDPDQVKQIFVDVGLRYMRGGEASYLKEGSIRREGDQVVFDTVRSRTDLVLLRVGLVLM